MVKIPGGFDLGDFGGRSGRGHSTPDEHTEYSIDRSPVGRAPPEPKGDRGTPTTDQKKDQRDEADDAEAGA